MKTAERSNCRERTADAFQPVSEMLDNGRCEPLKAAVHGLLFATVSVCAAYNAAAWVKRRQPHLAINAVIYLAAVWWERCHIMHHLNACPERVERARPERVEGACSAVEPVPAPQDNLTDAA